MNKKQAARHAVARAYFSKHAKAHGLPYENSPTNTDFPVDDFVKDRDLPQDATDAENAYAWRRMWQDFEKIWNEI